MRVIIDRPGPAGTPTESVSIEDCEQVNREISTILDVEDALDRLHLRCRRRGSIGRCAMPPTSDASRTARKDRGREAVDDQKHFEGRLRGVEVSAVLLEGSKGRKSAIPLNIDHARPSRRGILMKAVTR